jgi:phage terminase large subunit-like protein
MNSLKKPLQSSSLPRADREALAEALLERQRRASRRQFFGMFPDDGPLRRDLYQRHLEFMALGATHPTRCFMAANRTGKTQTGAFEVTCHATGLYPSWWQGRRFEAATDGWVAGDTKETVRDIIQAALVGPQGKEGTGMIPGDSIRKVAYRPNGNGAVDYVTVKHVSGQTSHIGFKSYDQKRESFQGTEKNYVWLDEESDEGIRAECVMRLMTTNGLLMETFTPLKGITHIVRTYLGESQPGDARTALTGDRAMVMAGWDDAPHLSDEQKARMLAECEPHLKDARSKGIPSLGSGAIYPIAEEDVLVDDFEIPTHWPRVYALDVGWQYTAAIWGAWDRDSDICYLVSDYKRGQCEPAIHAQAVKARGEWIPGVVDPASAGSSQKDGTKLMDVYRDLGLAIDPAINAVEAGILAVWERLSSGRLKVFKSLSSWRAEYRLYRRDEKGRIVKEQDHLMDSTRYLVMSGLDIAIVKPIPVDNYKQHATSGGWLGA